MMQLRDGADGHVNDSRSGDYEDCADSDGESLNQDEINKKLDDLKSCRLEDGELQIVSLGKSRKFTHVDKMYCRTCYFLL